MEIVNTSPKVYTIKDYLTDEECEHFIHLAQGKIKPALVSGDDEGYISSGRTGQNCWIEHDKDSITKKIANKIAKELNMPLENAEKYQIIYYDKNQEYRKHYDGWSFDGSKKSKRNMKYGGQRIKTALMYLNNVEEGGGTKFTKLNKEVNAEKGKLLVFENTHTGTNIKHELSEHAGMPVIKGEKWGFNLWFREHNMKTIYNYDESISLEKIKTDNKITLYDNVLTSDDIVQIINKCSFESKEKSCVWIKNNTVPDIIKKIEALVKIDKSYFENICVTKYSSNAIYRNHLDAYDMTTEKGKKYTSETGQRLLTITGAITNLKITFSKLQNKYTMNNSNILVYNNCYDNSNERNLDMIKYYSPLANNCEIIVFNIYIRERNTINNKHLKISNNIKEQNIQEIENNLSTDQIINLIYKYSKNATIPGFKLVNKAPINYVIDMLLKIKNMKNSLNNEFLNPVNLEKEYIFNEYNPVVVENVVTKDIHEIIDEYFKTNIKNKVYIFGDRQSKRYKILDEIMTRLLHLEFLPLIEKIVGKKMKPTYTYLSAYVKGSDLPPHTDRAECEYTCSYIIGKPQNSNWNIYVDKRKRPKKYEGRVNFIPPKEECIAVDCNENGLMIFNGTDHPHYREPLEHEYYNIVLLHYCSK